MTTLTSAITTDASTRNADACVDVRCDHCGLPVPAGLVRSDAARQFCCDGCATVWQMIHDHGLDPYYRMRDDADADTPAAPAPTTGLAYDELDDASFQRVHVRTRDDGLCATELLLEGVHCAACVWLVEKLPRITLGVIDAKLELRGGLLRLTWDPHAAPLSAIARMLDRLGYPAHPARGVEQRRIRRAEDRAALIRIAVAGACAGNAMLVAIALYAGDYSGMDDTTRTALRWVSMLLGVTALAWPGATFFRGALAAIRTRTAHLDLPIALGLAAGAVAGVINTLLGRGDVYFDSLAVLVLLLLIGRFIQRRHHARAADAVELLFSLWPGSCRRVDADGSVRQVAIESVLPGDVLEVRAGESIPVDGVVTDGDSAVDQSLLTGESAPVSIGEGDSVFAGTTNVAAALRVRVETTGEQTRAGKLMRLVERATQCRPRIVQWADRVAGWFVVVAVLAATGTFVAWSMSDVALAADHAVALLIVACPCALGLATPLVIAVALGRSAQRHILIKDGDVLQRLATPGVILLDKTGTLTTGRMSVARWVGDASVRPLVAAVEAQSSHPIARALAECADTDADAASRATDVQQRPDGGITGVVDGRRLAIGSATFVRVSDIAIPSWADKALDACVHDGLTAVIVAVDGDVAAVVGVGDTLRPDAAEAVAELRRRGWRVGMLSGDHVAVANAVARRVGIDTPETHGVMTPEAKAAYVRDRLSHSRGPVVMVGDGVNDAAALGGASVGIAVHGVAEASLAAAHVYVARPGLRPIVDLLDAAQRTGSTMRRNLAVSLGYNAFTVSLAALGFITPLLAAVLMPISSFTVLTIAVARRTFPRQIGDAS